MRADKWKKKYFALRSMFDPNTLPHRIADLSSDDEDDMEAAFMVKEEPFVPHSASFVIHSFCHLFALQSTYLTRLCTFDDGIKEE